MGITTEDLISSLLSIGYNEVNQTLFTKAKGIILTSKAFRFADYSISKVFNSFIVFDGNSFKIREGLSSKILNQNEELTNYLKTNGFGIVNTQILDKPKARALVMKSSN